MSNKLLKSYKLQRKQNIVHRNFLANVFHFVRPNFEYLGTNTIVLSSELIVYALCNHKNVKFVDLKQTM